MTSDNNRSSITGTFAEIASRSSAPETGEWRISAGARVELENSRDLEDALEAHDRKWRNETRKIAAASDPYPDFDLGSRAHRNILAEYEERRTLWEMERDGVEQSFAAKREDIRNTNPTLSGVFADRERNDGPIHDEASFSFPASERNQREAGTDRDEGRTDGRSL